ncbi:MAG: CPBP family intramembrane metalloprotease [Acidobacteriales bacterium]|nr:CPBP family intramembrane metalloprotease [Terriglobales bacterium]
MATTPATTVGEPQATKPAPIAARWHTILLMLVLLMFSFSTAKRHQPLTGKQGHVVLYVATMAWQYLLLGYVYFGVRRHGGRLRDLVGGRWNEVEDFLIDVGIAAAYWLVSAVVLASLLYALGFSDPAKMQEARKVIEVLMPQNRIEIILWIGVSITAGFCEEIIFRGYLQRQLAAFSGSMVLGVVGQALLFGLGHGYQGPERMFVIAVWGSMFGLLALWRKSLRPGMMAHTFHDLLAGLAGRFMVSGAR